MTAVWDQIGIDLTGPLKETASGNRYIEITSGSGVKLQAYQTKMHK